MSALDDLVAALTLRCDSRRFTLTTTAATKVWRTECPAQAGCLPKTTSRTLVSYDAYYRGAHFAESVACDTADLEAAKLLLATRALEVVNLWDLRQPTMLLA